MPKKLVYSGEIGNELVKAVWAGNWTELVLCSEGGDTDCCRAICDYLLSHEKRILVTGKCMSAATAIVACGNPAIATPSTRFMVHKSNIESVSGTAREMVNHGEELKLWDEWYVNLLEQRTKASSEQWRELCSEETCFGSKVALELGLVDEVL